MHWRNISVVKPKAALYFLGIEDFEWNFDEAMFG